MDLKWEKDAGHGVDLYENGRCVGWIDCSIYPYEVHIPVRVTSYTMPCEETKYVTLRKAMRALKETVTVLLIGRGYET